jgi:hypothetical protein
MMKKNFGEHKLRYSTSETGISPEFLASGWSKAEEGLYKDISGIVDRMSVPVQQVF